jgi:hypothetical protein
VFYSTVTNCTASHDVITDFDANDVVYLAGYGSGEASNDLNMAVSSGGNTTVALSDNTQITFLGVASANTLSGQVVSF